MVDDVGLVFCPSRGGDVRGTRTSLSTKELSWDQRKGSKRENPYRESLGEKEGNPVSSTSEKKSVKFEALVSDKEADF